MTPDDLMHSTCYPSARQGREDAAFCVESPQTQSPTYRLAFDDPDFLVRDEMRGMRLQLELMKPELELQANNINSSIVVFGSARAADFSVFAFFGCLSSVVVFIFFLSVLGVTDGALEDAEEFFGEKKL